MAGRKQHQYKAIGRLLLDAGFNPNGQCYCGCGRTAGENRYFSKKGGCDRKLDTAFLEDPKVSALLQQAIKIHMANTGKGSLT